jgi:uncharacterized protein YcbK (DUF882 family)
LTARGEHGSRDGRSTVIRRPTSAAFLLVTALGVVTFAPHARAQSSLASAHVYVVAHGDTVSSIAQRLGVSVHALTERNRLDPPYALRIGRRLRLPDEIADAIARRLPLRDPAAMPASSSIPVRGAPRHGETWGRPRQPGIVHLYREVNDETLTINLRRHVTRTAQRRMEHFLRFPDGRSHPIHPRLLRLMAIVSDHFGGRRLHVISGFRPFRRGQWTAHSNHNIGSAVDFRVEGVPNRTVRDFCRTLEQTGCGYYPRSVFVHMDVRDESATWVDWSRPGQRPLYGREDGPPPEHANVHAPPHETEGADESLDDVAADEGHISSAAPTDDNDGPGPATASADEHPLANAEHPATAPQASAAPP